MRAAVGRSTCLHCGLPTDSPTGGFCCVGCEAVYGLLHREHLEGYYSLRGGGRGAPPPAFAPGRRDFKWLERLEASMHLGEGVTHVTMDVQGLHCIGCVWLIEKLFARTPGGRRIVVNPAIGRAQLWIERSFALADFVASVERFGYLFGPPVKREPGGSRDLIARLGFCVAIAMNSMIFGIAIYAGLDRGPLYSLFTTLNFGLGAAAVAVGGTVFFRSAWRAASRGVLHLDLPIALGIALAFLGSAHSYFARRPEGTYFDTLDVFIALMLVGRWLQERVLERNRAWLLASDGTEGLLARRVERGRVGLVPCGELREGDVLLVAPGDLVPLDSRLEHRSGRFSLDWIQGESRPRTYSPNDIVPAGAFAAGNEAATLRALSTFEGSPLRELLREPQRSTPDIARSSPWWQRLARWYVVGVLAAAGSGLLAWWATTGDFARAVAVTTAVLVVSCPCAFGIATPLAYEMVQTQLRRRGLFVRRAGFLDRARTVRRVVFDKTGTLTTGALALADRSAVARVEPGARRVLYNLAARSAHPKSRAIREALEPHGVSLDADCEVVEHPGLGLEVQTDGISWRLGTPHWAAPDSPVDPVCDVAFGRDGRLVAAFTTIEQPRQDAATEVRALQDAGCEVWLASGDAQERVDAAGRASGIAPDLCRGGLTAQDKSEILRRIDRSDTLFVGDGVNDALAIDAAHVSGTPAVDRPFVPARADFFFVTPGLEPIRFALRSSRVLAQVVRADLAIAIAYNALTVSLALAGKMSPLACAVLMPLSSMTTIAVTLAALSPRSPLWKS
ncbi:MAG TPA: HAD-IC family P-type ATPase [Polyangiaceae bacterium]|nr:HAD-IC family P-type ATPase [Polyangiaceae bacterium]